MNQEIIKSVKKIGLKARKYSPQILAGFGAVGTVASAVLACKATTKAGDIYKKLHSDIEKIDKVDEKTSDEEYNDKDRKKDLCVVYGHAAIDYIKLYGPSIALGAFSIGCMLSANRILSKRNAVLATAYASVNKGFKEYRKRVAEKYGDKAEKEIRYNVKAKEFEKEVKGKDGKTKTKTEKVKVLDPNTVSPFAKFYDEYCQGWSPDAEHNLYFLTCQQEYANQKLQCQGYLFLNDVYNMLGMKATQMGQFVGWVYDKDNPIGDNFVDFGIYDINRETNRDFVNGYEKSILLDFNVDGNILDLIVMSENTGKDYNAIVDDTPGILSTHPCSCNLELA